MQVMHSVIGGVIQRLILPAPEDHVLPGIPWGKFDHILTPAYWRGQVWQHEQIGTYASFRLGRTLTEEAAACLLGGYGMKAELGLAAYARLRDRGLLQERIAADVLENALSEPFVIHDQRRGYRFPRQKARYLSACLKQLAALVEVGDDTALRDQLTQLPGIGPKTASWIVRNYRASNAVAIIDVHILRAGRHISLFHPKLDPMGHYRELEQRFLRFAEALSTPAAILDCLMWDYMRRLSASLLARTPVTP